MDPQEAQNGRVPVQTYSKFLNSCDACRARKVRCIKKSHSNTTCISCDKRSEDCHFSRTKVRKLRTTQASQVRRQPQTEEQPMSHGAAAEPATPLSQVSSSTRTGHVQNASDTAVPLLCEGPNDSATEFSVPGSQVESSSHATFGPTQGLSSPQLTVADHPVIMLNEQGVSSSSLAYFSNPRLMALSTKLGHGRVAELIHRIDFTVRSRTRHPLENIPSPNDYEREARSVTLSPELTSKYIQSYFEELHPIYPFLDRESFEKKAFSPHLAEYLSADHAWCALYHAIVSLGSLYHDCGSFTVFSGTAWDIFRISLSLFSRIVFGRRTLVAAQAMTAMALFGMTYVSTPMEEALVTEAARIAMSLQLHKSNSGESNLEAQKTFWVIHALENEFCFNTARSSAIPNHDVSCPVPQVMLPPFDEFNWLRFFTDYAQMISRIYERLFSVKARSLPIESLRTEATRAFEQLASWKDSATKDLRPDLPIRAHQLGKPQAVALAIQIRFYYHNVRMALSRISLSLTQDSGEQMGYKLLLTESARAVIDAVHLIHLEPFVIPWLQYHMPQAALFLLFDFVIDHPCHTETKKNLSYLQIVASYFMRLRLASDITSCGTIPTELYQIAAKFVEDTAASEAPERGIGEAMGTLDGWLSDNNGVDLGALEEFLSFQCGAFPNYHDIGLEEVDFLFTDDRDTAAFARIDRSFNASDCMRGLFSEAEQANGEQEGQ